MFMQARTTTNIEVCVVAPDNAELITTVESLRAHGFGVRHFSDAHKLYQGLLGTHCDILVIDLDLADLESGIAIEQLCALPHIGVVILSADTEIQSAVQALSDGADLHLTKPVAPLALAANIRSLHRRLADPAIDSPGWRLRGDGWSLLAPNGQTIALTASERIVLQMLFGQPGAAVRRDAIITALGHQPDYYLDHRLDMLISRLRKKVRTTAGLSLPLKTVRSVGFILAAGDLH